MARNDREFRLACVVSDYLAKVVPALPITHVPLGEKRTPVTGERVKRMGARAGFPDYLGAMPPHGRLLALELKTDAGRLRPNQKAVREALEAAGAAYAVIRSLDDLRAVLELHGVPTLERAA